MKPIITTRPHEEFLKKYLADPIEAAAYLNAIAEDNELDFLLEALRDVVEAQGGVGALAKKTRLSRTTLYKTLSSRGNPEFNTLDAILNVYGLRIGFFPINGKGHAYHWTESAVADRRRRYGTLSSRGNRRSKARR
ncbi:MAG: addiction module antidote protein [Elusimicrobia bacterium]|nr:addiction module antidote protein [Elusimicrobiota bacterium]